MHWLKFFINYFKPTASEDRLVMTILCRNEIDIIEWNIRVHAFLGVDAFVVMDNGSTDGTREKLDELSKEFELHVIDQLDTSYQQSKWMKQLAVYARDKLSASWVISNDADEFWLPQDSGKSLKDYLKHCDSVVSVTKKNMLMLSHCLEKGDGTVWGAEYRVQHPIAYPKVSRLQENNIAILLNETPGKVIVNPNGFLKISGGNHRAKHIGKLISARRESGILVYHYPFRSWEQFKARVEQDRELLKLPGVKVGNHARRWVRLLEEGNLFKEFQSFLMGETELKALIKYGVAVEDKIPKELFARVRKKRSCL